MKDDLNPTLKDEGRRQKDDLRTQGRRQKEEGRPPPQGGRQRAKGVGATLPAMTIGGEDRRQYPGNAKAVPRD